MNDELVKETRVNETRPRETRLQRHLWAPWRGLAFWFLGIPAMFVGVWFITVVSMISSFLGVLLFPSAVGLLRAQLDAYRSRINKWTDSRIARPYLPEPEVNPGLNGMIKRFVRLISDPATWRDYLWVAIDPIVVLFTAALPGLLVLYGLWGFAVATFVGGMIGHYAGADWYGYVHITDGYDQDLARIVSTLFIATVSLVAGLLIGPKMLNVYGQWGRFILGPTRKSELALRVRHLTETRSEAVDASAAELRRIERDLHDGA
ncbi:MAG: sensor domain-containing protein, partial [Spirillospora sp.]